MTRRLTQLKNNQHSIDSENSGRKSFYPHCGSSSHALSNSVINIPEETNIIHIVQIRLVFIHIGKKNQTKLKMNFNK